MDTELLKTTLLKAAEISDNPELLRAFERIHKTESGCARCGWNVVYNGLQYHHINPADKNGHISDIAKSGNLQKLIDEIDKCEVLCANCHAVETHGQWGVECEKLGNLGLKSFRPLYKCLEEGKIIAKHLATQEEVVLECNEDIDALGLQTTAITMVLDGRNRHHKGWAFERLLER